MTRDGIGALAGFRLPEKAHSSIISIIWKALMVRRQRRALGRLDGDALRDVGLTPEQARREAARPIWDMPQICCR